MHVSNRERAARILVADDDASFRCVAKEVVGRLACSMIEACDGLEAVALSREHCPDVIVLDINMPGCDGIEACKQIRAENATQITPILLVTGIDDRSTIERAYNSGATDLVEKPVRWPVFSRRLNIMLRYSRLIKRLQTTNALNLRLGRVLDNSQNEIYVFQEPGKPFIQVNKAGEENLGHSSAELYGMAPLDIVSGNGAGELSEQCRRLQEGTESEAFLQLELRRKNGTCYPVEARLHYSGEETPPVYIIIAQDISERMENERKMIRLAYYDSLTGLANREFFIETMSRSIHLARRNNTMLGVLFIDLDRFKRINDTLGHSWGDEFLRKVGRTLVHSVRDCDLISHPNHVEGEIARLGGDEFVVLLENLEDNCLADSIAQRIMENLQKPVVLGEQEIVVTVSIGISVFPLDGDTPDTLVKHADVAMYNVKKRGRNGFAYFHSSMNARAMKRLQMEQHLRHAIDNREFVLLYQPQVCVATGEVVSLEALIRWGRPGTGVVSPDDFIPLAEELGLILPIGNWVIMEACRQIERWIGQGLPPIKVAVNVSGHQIYGVAVVESVKQALAETGIAPQWLELELTESVVMENAEQTIKVIQTLKSLGVTLSIDDFGTGYSSLSYLKRFPLDVLKIDRMFITNVTTDTDDAAIVKAIVAMAHSLKLKVVAEGVETTEQLAFLDACGVDLAQGYLFSKPVTGDKYPLLPFKSVVNHRLPQQHTIARHNDRSG